MNRIKHLFSPEEDTKGVFTAHGIRLTCPLLRSEYLTKTRCPIAVKIGDDLYVSDPIYSLIKESDSQEELKLVLDSIRTFVIVAEKSVLRNVLLLERTLKK